MSAPDSEAAPARDPIRPPEPAPAPAPPAPADPREPITIRWKPGGPYVVQGPVVVRDPDGRELTPPPAKVPGQVKLCGCGHSQTKPFCDGSHKTCGAPAAGR